MKHVIGIDVSKATSQVAVVTDEQVLKQFKITNDAFGFETLNQSIKQFETVPEIVFEATGVYSARLQHFLEINNYPYYRLNPLAAKKQMDQLRPQKNDVSDALGLAQTQLKFARKETFVELPIYYELTALSRQYQELTSDTVMFKNRLHTALQWTFPEIEKLMSQAAGERYWQIVSLFPHARRVINRSVQEITERLLSTGPKQMRKKHAEMLAIKLYKLASASAPAVPSSSSRCETIQYYAAQLHQLDSLRNDKIKQMRVLSEQLPEFDIYMSIPGFAEKTVVGLIGELGDLHRFSSPNQINAFIGIDLRFNDSGEYHTKGFITKRGDHWARKILFRSIGNIASTATHGHPNHINDWYQNRKKSSPSTGTKKIAIGAMDRLISTMYHLVMTNQKYDYTIACRSKRY
ncbi:MAG TPA: IS110 family transposase [Lactobacillus sp.]|nr:IS110 family transposase [Lactobacillus sp.]